LALKLGKTVNELENSMDKEELFKWSLYFKQEKPDVNELQMSVLSNMIARYMGSKNSKHTDYLIRHQEPVKTKAISNDAIKNIFSAIIVE